MTCQGLLSYDIVKDRNKFLTRSSDDFGTITVASVGERSLSIRRQGRCNTQAQSTIVFTSCLYICNRKTNQGLPKRLGHFRNHVER